jgi:hypothetical protein
VLRSFWVFNQLMHRDNCRSTVTKEVVFVRFRYVIVIGLSVTIV